MVGCDFHTHTKEAQKSEAFSPSLKLHCGVDRNCLWSLRCTKYRHPSVPSLSQCHRSFSFQDFGVYRTPSTHLSNLINQLINSSECVRTTNDQNVQDRSFLKTRPCEDYMDHGIIRCSSRLVGVKLCSHTLGLSTTHRRAGTGLNHTSGV